MTTAMTPRIGNVVQEVEFAITRAVQEREHEMVRELLQSLNEFDGASTDSPSAVWYRALAKVRAMRSREQS